mmetsp:Transcript_2569/g.2540  ORF Transcript_2569/g.2540 Transcript_2569/m.2540 type:complete len:238 (+) Transcript_2569:55-768(+)
MERKKLIIVRHGERIDEINPMEWLNYCKTNYNERSIEFNSRLDDPHLTNDGLIQAQEVAESILHELQGIDIPYIYCSKLIRAVQTAYYIALRLSKPIVVSKGFALTAAAVGNAGNSFNFLSIDEIRGFCPDIEIIDGDVEESYLIPSDNWHYPLKHVINNHSVSLVVAHRETIRNLARERLKTPYCCYGIFDIPVDDENNPQLNMIKLEALMQRDRNRIHNEPPKVHKKGLFNFSFS